MTPPPIPETRPALAIVLAGLSVWSCLAVSSCRGRPEPRRQAMLVLLDAAVPERFSCYGYPRATTPNLDALAERGIVFTRHYAQGTHTRAALPPLLYSRYFAIGIFPASDRIPLEDPEDLFLEPDERSISLPRAFSRAGVASTAISAHVWLREGTRFAAEWGELHDLSQDPERDPSYPYPRAELVIDRAIEWLRRHRREDFFLYLHLMDTHFPHRFEDDARRWLGGEPTGADRFRPDGTPRRPELPLESDERAYLDALYDGSLSYADRHLGRLFAFLDAEGLLDGMLLAVTADHGEHLLETPPRFGHGGPWYERVARVPLILFQPARLEPGRYDGLSESVDLLPTMLGAFGIPWEKWGVRVDGVDLLELLGGTRPAREHALMSRGIRGPRYKWLPAAGPRELLGGEAPPLETLGGELYDLEADPEERRNLWAEKPEIARRLLGVYRRRLAGPYRRYLASKTDAPPPGPFAIGANRFELAPREGWRRVEHWEKYALHASGGAAPVEVAFPLPDGEYQLSAEICGRLGLELPDGARFELEAAGSDCEKGDREFVEAGPVEVRGRRFRITLHAPTERGARGAIYHLGFRPSGPGSEEMEIDRERLEQLEALGYVSTGDP